MQVDHICLVNPLFSTYRLYAGYIFYFFFQSHSFRCRSNDYKSGFSMAQVFIAMTALVCLVDTNLFKPIPDKLIQFSIFKFVPGTYQYISYVTKAACSRSDLSGVVLPELKTVTSQLKVKSSKLTLLLAVSCKI